MDITFLLLTLPLEFLREILYLIFEVEGKWCFHARI